MTTIQLPRQLRVADIEVTAASNDTIDVVWTTGAVVRRRSAVNGVYDEELVVTAPSVRLGRLNDGAPFLNTHDDYRIESVIGSVVSGSATIDNKGRGLASIKLSRAPADADIVGKIKDRIIRSISVGYVVHEVEIDSDRDVPLWRCIDWEPFELSAVAVPADPGAHVRSGVAASPLYECRTFDHRDAIENELARMRMAKRFGATETVASATHHDAYQPGLYVDPMNTAWFDPRRK
jgi:phage head maturation protease